MLGLWEKSVDAQDNCFCWGEKITCWVLLETITLTIDSALTPIAIIEGEL